MNQFSTWLLRFRTLRFLLVKHSVTDFCATYQDYAG